MKRITVGIGLVAAIAALLPAIAASATRPDDRPVHGTGLTALAESRPTAARPDDLGASRGPGALVQTASTRPDDRSGPRGPGRSSPQAIVAPSGGFDWGDAGIGAFGGAGFALLLAGGIAFAAGRRTGARVVLR